MPFSPDFVCGILSPISVHSPFESFVRTSFPVVSEELEGGHLDTIDPWCVGVNQTTNKKECNVLLRRVMYSKQKLPFAGSVANRSGTHHNMI